MADIKWTFFADTAAAERAIQALEQKYTNLEAGIKQVSRRSKEASEDGGAAFDFLTDKVTATVGAIAGVVTVTKLASSVLQDYHGEVDGAAAAIDRMNQKLITQAALQNKIKAAPEIAKFVEGVPGVTRQQAELAFEGVQGGAPNIPLDSKFVLARTAAAFAPVLAPLNAAGQVEGGDKLQGLGDLMGKLYEMGPEKPIDDVADLALSLQQKLGNRVDQLKGPGFEKGITALLGKNVGFEQALATAAEALDKGVDPGVLANVAAKLKPEKGLTLDAILADDKLASKTLGGKMAANINLLDQGKIARLQSSLMADQQGNLGEQVLRQSAAAFPLQFARQSTVAADEKGDAAYGERKLQMDELQRQRIEGAPGWWSRQSERFGAFMESAHTVGRDLFGFSDVQQDVQDYSRQNQPAVNTSLEQVVNLLEVQVQQNNQMIQQGQPQPEQVRRRPSPNGESARGE